MSDVRATAGVPLLAQFGGIATPSACPPLIVNNLTGFAYTLKTGDIVVRVGNVVGPASSTDGNVVFFDGATGLLIKDSGLTLSGTNTGDQTSVSGNAGTATALQNVRTLWGNNFDGTANVTGKITASTNGIDVPTSAAGTAYSNHYTPTLTGVQNVTSSTARDIGYARTGNWVTGAGQFDVNPTAAGQVIIGVSLPVSSNFSTGYEGGGAGGVQGIASAVVVLIDTTNKRFSLLYQATASGAQTVIFSFGYQVV